MKKIIFTISKILIICFILISTAGFSQEEEQKQSLPVVVDPGDNWNAPSDAIILFGDGSLDQFESVSGGPAGWVVSGNHFTVKPGTGNIHTRRHFGDCQLHIEWRTPPDASEKEGQKSGNSGIYLMGKYEVQVLNSYNNETYPDGQAGAVYRQYPPLVNASRKPGEWQVYDIVFYAPEFNDDGIETRRGYVTVFHNGVLIQYNSEILGPTTAYNKNIPEDATKGPLMLQDHSNEVSFRNIWIRELKK